MNGNQLADVLRWGGEGEYQHEWYAGQELPKEWWKTDFPYREAEKMGYRLSPEKTREFYRKKKEAEREKTLSEELADILKRPEVKMLDPLQRADLIEKIQKAQAAIAKREEEREKHEAEMLEKGREAQLREGVQDILRSDRVPAQKVTALTVAGVPLSEARKLVWGERAPEEEARRPTREAAPTARPEELAAALRPEEPKGVQFRMIEGELFKEPAGRWEERLTPEQKAAKREAELKEADYYRRRALERKYPQLAIPLEERKFTAEEKKSKREFEADVKEVDRRYELDVEELGETKAENLRSYNLDKLKEDRTWKETLFDMGFKDKEFNELSKRFWETLDFNKETEERKAKEFDVKFEWDKEKEANVMDRFEEKLKQEYKQLDLDIKRFGLNKEIEARIAKMALFNFELDRKKLGLDEAIAKWKRIAEKREWYFKEEELRLKNTQAQRLFKEFMHRITQDAKEFRHKVTVFKEKSRQWQEKFDWDKEQAELKAGIAISSGLALVLDEAFGENKGRVVSAFKNLKAGYKPAAKELDDLYNKLFGTDEFGLEDVEAEPWADLDGPAFCKKVWGHTKWNDTFKCWVISKRDDPDWWNAQLLERGTPVEPKTPGVSEGKEGFVWWKPSTWFEKKDIAKDAQSIMNASDTRMTREELKAALKKEGYSESDITKLWDMLKKGR